MPGYPDKKSGSPAGHDNGQMAMALPRLSLEGLVSEIIFRNDDNGYTVLQLDDAEESTVVGTLPFLSPGEPVRFFGVWKEHPDYGRQFAATHYELIAPQSTQAIELYLAGGLISGIGKALARRLVAAFGEDTLDILRDQPEKTVMVKGISLRKARHIADQLIEKRDFQELILLLAPLGIGSGKALRIFKRYGTDAVRLISENPYRLADEVFGIGFLTADRLAMQLGLDRQSPARLCSAVRYVLAEAAGSGHTYLPAPVLVRRTAGLLQTEIVQPSALLASCQAQKQIVRIMQAVDEKQQERVALPAVYATEHLAAVRLRLLQQADCRKKGFSTVEQMQAAMGQACSRSSLILAPEQARALALALTEPVMILTGGPGTGKTTILRLLCDCLEEKKNRVLLAAPTGRAAKRLSEATGRTAKTLHRLLSLQFNPDDEDQDLAYRARPDTTLAADLIIVDEASMIDIFLLRSLLEAIEPGTRLLLVGDADQLPSVGPGDVLGDLIASAVVPTARLTRVYRQSAESLIIRNAHRIHDGQWPELDQAHESQFLFIPGDSADSVARTVTRLVQVILPREYGLDPLRDVFVLTPTRKGAAGTMALNKVLQDVLLPAPAKRDGLHAHGFFFGVGDKVMQTRNNYELAWHLAEDKAQQGSGVFNGETGTVAAVDKSTASLQVIFDDERVVLYDRASLDDLELAYAMTIHKSQGSEYPVVILAVAPGAPQLLSRNLLYTAVTRARHKLLLVSSRRVIGQMLANERAQDRYTCLKDWLTCEDGTLQTAINLKDR